MRLSPDIASALFGAICSEVERMLWLDVLHADLSPCNILWTTRHGESVFHWALDT